MPGLMLQLDDAVENNSRTTLRCLGVMPRTVFEEEVNWLCFRDLCSCVGEEIYMQAAFHCEGLRTDFDRVVFEDIPSCS